MDNISRIELNDEYDLNQRKGMVSLFDALRPDGPTVIDLTKVTYVDATFLSELIRLRRRLKQLPITLAGANGKVMRVLKLVSFESLFEITG
jgi:anti-anti-sigma regulatory factor